MRLRSRHQRLLGDRRTADPHLNPDGGEVTVSVVRAFAQHSRRPRALGEVAAWQGLLPDHLRRSEGVPEERLAARREGQEPRWMTSCCFRFAARPTLKRSPSDAVRILAVSALACRVDRVGEIPGEEPRARADREHSSPGQSQRGSVAAARAPAFLLAAQVARSWMPMVRSIGATTPPGRAESRRPMRHRQREPAGPCTCNSWQAVERIAEVVAIGNRLILLVSFGFPSHPKINPACPRRNQALHGAR